MWCQMAITLLFLSTSLFFIGIQNKRIEKNWGKWNEGGFVWNGALIGRGISCFFVPFWCLGGREFLDFKTGSRSKDSLCSNSLTTTFCAIFFQHFICRLPLFFLKNLQITFRIHILWKKNSRFFPQKTCTSFRKRPACLLLRAPWKLYRIASICLTSKDQQIFLMPINTLSIKNNSLHPPRPRLQRPRHQLLLFRRPWRRRRRAGRPTPSSPPSGREVHEAQEPDKLRAIQRHHR